MRRLATAAATTALVTGLVVGSAGTAQAADHMYWTGGTKADCEKVQRTYISSWTKITKSCYRNGNGWAFHWSSIG